MLRSKLFSGNRELKEASENHARHIVRNHKQTGDFVSKIQEALIILDNAILTGSEIPDQRYGNSTADAVLAYKTSRGVINHTYQKTADDIVGIMTMARLDKDMLEIEGRMAARFEASRTAAFQRTFAAFMRVAAIGPPGEPGRVDPNAVSRQRATELARAIFNNQNPDMDDIASVLGDMKNRLMANVFDLAHLPDSRIGGRDAFVVGNRLPFVLCPHFFATSDEQRIRTMVHESAHLTGIGDPNGESYYLKFNIRNEAPNFTVGNPRSTRREDFADTWAKYVNAVMAAPADPDDSITR